jgi:hypothetical protein
MPDEADIAQATEELFLKSALQGVRSGPQLRARGSCYNCDERLPNHAQLFCDGDCANDYAKRQRLAGR